MIMMMILIMIIKVIIIIAMLHSAMNINNMKPYEHCAKKKMMLDA